MTLAGAKQQLKQNKEATLNKIEIIDRLKQIREELTAMRKALDYLT